MRPMPPPNRRRSLPPLALHRALVESQRIKVELEQQESDAMAGARDALPERDVRPSDIDDSAPDETAVPVEKSAARDVAAEMLREVARARVLELEREAMREAEAEFAESPKEEASSERYWMEEDDPLVEEIAEPSKAVVALGVPPGGRPNRVVEIVRPASDPLPAGSYLDDGPIDRDMILLNVTEVKSAESREDSNGTTAVFPGSNVPITDSLTEIDWVAELHSLPDLRRDGDCTSFARNWPLANFTPTNSFFRRQGRVRLCQNDSPRWLASIGSPNARFRQIGRGHCRPVKVYEQTRTASWRYSARMKRRSTVTIRSRQTMTMMTILIST